MFVSLLMNQIFEEYFCISKPKKTFHNMTPYIDFPNLFWVQFLVKIKKTILASFPGT